MPGVTDDWEHGRSRHSFEYNKEEGMSPHRREGRKHSSYSNGYSSDQQSDSNDEGPLYLLEHLATFSVSPAHGIASPADGMRRLLQMEKTSGIWTQKMQLKLEKKWVIIIDYENGDIVEKFPHQQLSDPTAFTSTDPKELYNNILVFIVREDPKKKNLNPSEMHIFQCVRISAQEVVDDIKMIISGKWRSGYSRDPQQIPPPPADPAPEPPINGQARINVREQVSRFDAVAAATTTTTHDVNQQRSQSLVSPQQPNTRSEMRTEIRTNYVRDANEDSESNCSEKYERDVAVLNHCFDDIERFIARLQHAAAAFRELERRKKSRKSKKKDLGDGMLSMRAKPPPEREFVDIFQKFKLSFNLLAKLKSHIHDPNAPELVHFLFTPLTLIVDASRDSNYGPNLPSKVIIPLLTRDALDLLANCLTSKESELWHSLGDSWLVPRDQWKGYTSSYHPVFMDGWSPDYSFSEDKERSEVAGGNTSGPQRNERDQEYHHTGKEDGRYDGEFYYGSDRGGDRGSPGPMPPPPHHEAPRPPQSYENRHYESRQHQESRKNNYLDRERTRTPPSERDYHGEREYRGGMDREYRRELDRDYPPERDYRGPEYKGSMEREYRSDLERDYRGPVDRDSRDRIEVRSDFSADSIERSGSPGPGPIPVDTSHQFERQQRQWVDDLRARGSKIVQVTYPRTANNDKEMTVVRGEFLEVLDDSRKWWKARNVRGQVGHVPHTIVTPHQGTEEEIFNNPLYSSRGGLPARDPYYGLNDSPRDRSDDSNLGSHQDGSHQVVASRSPVPASADWIRRERQGKKGRTTQEILNEELKSRISGSASLSLVGNKNKGLQYYISMKSSASEVKEWLISKEFSAQTIATFAGVTGSQLFLFSKAHFEEMCGREEGSRLESQVRIQKTTCGYNTMKKRGEELSTILARRKEELEKEGSDRSSSSASSPSSNQSGPTVKKKAARNVSDASVTETKYNFSSPKKEATNHKTVVVSDGENY